MFISIFFKIIFFLFNIIFLRFSFPFFIFSRTLKFLFFPQRPFNAFLLSVGPNSGIMWVPLICVDFFVLTKKTQTSINFLISQCTVEKVTPSNLIVARDGKRKEISPFALMSHVDYQDMKKEVNRSGICSGG